MAILFDAPVTPDALTAFVQKVPTPDEQVLNRLLPDRYLTRNKIDVAQLTQTNRTAQFRSWDGRLHVSKRDTVTLQTVELPPLSTSYSKGEYEALQEDFARTAGSNTAALVAAVYDDATNGTREVLARMEQARGDVLMDGKFTLTNEGGLTLEADFGVPANHIVSAAIPWSTTASATIIDNLTAWKAVYVATNGFPPGGMVLSDTVLGYMLRNAELRTLAAVLTGTPSLVTRQSIDAAMQAYNLPPISFVYDAQVDVDGTSTRVLDATKVIFHPPNPSDLGYTAWGVTATARKLVNSPQSTMSFEEAPGIVGLVIEEGPPYREFTFIDACGMPILEAPKRLFVADVA